MKELEKSLKILKLFQLSLYRQTVVHHHTLDIDGKTKKINEITQEIHVILKELEKVELENK